MAKKTGTLGNDNVNGGKGADVTIPVKGVDPKSGGSSNESLKGSKGNDVIIAGAGNDRLNGGSGNDTLDGGAGNDRLNGGRGNDVINGGTGNDRLNGSSGNDTLDGGAGNDRLNGGRGNDVIHGGAGNDRLNGSSGNDVLDGGAGNDTVDGSAGNDVLVYRASENLGSADVYVGGSGVDTLQLQLTRAEWLSAAVQLDIANYLTFLGQSVNGWNGEASNGAKFKFTAFNLQASMLEKLDVYVDGVKIDPRDQDVVLGNDVLAVGEDDGAHLINVMANDSVPDLVKSISFTQPAHGTVELAQQDFASNISTPLAVFSYTPTASAWQSLAAGEQATDSFTYTIVDADGDLKTATVTVTVEGSNDGPVVTNSVQQLAGELAEDSSEVSGQLAATDVDHGAVLSWSVQGAADGSYGRMSVDANGKWTYVLNNDSAAVQALAQGETRLDSFTIRVADEHGAAVDQVIAVTVTGTNDGPVVSNTSAALTGSVTEDQVVSASGQLSATDVDNGAALSWSVQGSERGAFGSISVDASTGQWIYAFDNDAAANQALAAGESHVENFTVRVADEFGASVDQIVMIEVAGANDGPVVTNTSTALAGSVAEDRALSVSGQLSATDIDHGATQSWSVLGDGVGSYGSMSVDGNGKWTYTLNNSAAAVQQLGASDVRTEDFTLRVTDEHGAFTDQVVQIAVNGTADVTAVNDVLNDTFASAPVTLTFEYGTYTQEYGYNDYYYYNNTSILTNDGFRLSPEAWNSNGTWVTSYWGADNSNAAAGYYNGIVLARTDGGDFSFSGANMTSYFSGRYQTVVGYDNGTEVARDTVYIPSANGYYYNHNNPVSFNAAGWANVDRVVFESPGDYLWLDNVKVTNTIHTVVTEDNSGNIDVLANDAGAASVASFTDSQFGAAVSLNANGTLHYDASVSAALQALGANDTVTDTFSYVAGDANGGLSNAAQVAVIVHGVNDNAVFSVQPGANKAGLTEDGILHASKTIQFADVDVNDTHTVSVQSLGANLGTLTASMSHDSTGSGTGGAVTWDYNVDNASLQYLAQGETRTETFAVQLNDGTSVVTQNISVTLTGANDAPVAQDDLVIRAAADTVLSFEPGTYTYSYDYNYDYYYGYGNSLVTNDGFKLTAGNSNYYYSGGVDVTGYWGADYSNAAYSYSTDMVLTRVDGADFAMSGANMTSYYSGRQQTVIGYDNGLEVARQTFDIPGTGDYYYYDYYGSHNNPVTFSGDGWTNVDQVVFQANSDYLWLDNVVSLNGLTEDRSMNINVLANDSDVDSNAQLSVASFSATSALGAQVSLNADGTLRYDPTQSAQLQALHEGDQVTDTITYAIKDQFGAVSNTATVSLLVKGLDDVSLILGGSDGNDTLAGRAGDDVIIGGAGSDIMTGGFGSDLFIWGNAGEGGDLITDFQAGTGGDVLNIRDVLSGYTSAHASDFVHLLASGNDTVVQVNSDGAGNDFVNLVTLQGVSGLLLDDLLANNNLVAA